MGTGSTFKAGGGQVAIVPVVGSASPQIPAPQGSDCCAETAIQITRLNPGREAGGGRDETPEPLTRTASARGELVTRISGANRDALATSPLNL
jgi:hypothetical protein